MESWKVTGLKYTPQDIGILLNGRVHSEECDDKLQFSYQMNGSGSAKNLKISCPKCGFKMEFDGEADLEINLEINIKGKKRK